jgi:hypothetical protein
VPESVKKASSAAAISGELCGCGYSRRNEDRELDTGRRGRRLSSDRPEREDYSPFGMNHTVARINVRNLEAGNRLAHTAVCWSEWPLWGDAIRSTWPWRTENVGSRSLAMRELPDPAVVGIGQIRFPSRAVEPRSWGAATVREQPEADAPAAATASAAAGRVAADFPERD